MPIASSILNWSSQKVLEKDRWLCICYSNVTHLKSCHKLRPVWKCSPAWYPPEFIYMPSGMQMTEGG